MRRHVWWALIAVALFFAVQGGEYSTRDLYVLHSRTRTLTRDVDSLQRQVDSRGRPERVGRLCQCPWRRGGVRRIFNIANCGPRSVVGERVQHGWVAQLVRA